MSIRRSHSLETARRGALLRAWQVWRFRLALGLIYLSLSTTCFGQSISDLPLHEREPFDRITLDAKNNSATLEIFPVPELQRATPADLQGRPVTIRKIEDPLDVQYRLDTKAIASYERFPDILLSAATEALGREDLPRTFQLIARLHQVTPNLPGLTSLEESFFFEDTKQLFRDRRYDESLLSLDEVFRRNPSRNGLDRALKSILSQILITEFADENYASVRAKLDFAKRKYGTIAGPLVAQWEQELTREGEKLFALAKTEFSAGRGSQALTALRRAADVLPTLSGLNELRQQILEKFPRVRVGVSQAYVANELPHSPASILDWAHRRSATLVQRQVLALDEYTADGARYRSDLGKLQVASDRTSMQLQLVPELRADGHRLAQQFLSLANPQANAFAPRWAEYVRDIDQEDATVKIRLTRATLRPDGLLPRQLPSDVNDLTQFRFQAKSIPDSKTTSFVRMTSSAEATLLSELTETVYADPRDACDALQSGRVDVVDRIWPGDYDRLANDSRLRLVPYRLPTVHGLVFGGRETILRNATFRRGLLYAINRPGFLNQELSSSKKTTARLLSGFAPIGRSDNDPLGYAYNPDFRPRPYDPSLALVLMRLALRTQAANADSEKKSAEVDPKEEASDSEESSDSAEVDGDDQEVAPPDPMAMPELTLAYPQSHLARTACGFIASNWGRLGISVTLRELEPGQAWPDDANWDVVYLEATVEEPLVDLPELFLGHQILGRHGGLVWHAMRSLQDATSLEDVRSEFAKVHRLTYDHTPMLPLWQVIEHAAVSKEFMGLSDAVISLYEDIDQWRLTP